VKKGIYKHHIHTYTDIRGASEKPNVIENKKKWVDG